MFEQLVPYQVEAEMVNEVGEQKADEIINENEETIKEDGKQDDTIYKPQ
jgi:hypothetical protein